MDSFNADDALKALYGGPVSLPANPRLFEIPASVGFKFVGGQVRGGEINFSHAFLIGTFGDGSICSRFYFDDCELDFVGDANTFYGSVGISILDSLSNESSSAWAWARIRTLTTEKTEAHDKIDLDGKTS